MIIGVLALQGDFAEHINILKKLKVKTKEIRLPEDLDNVDGLIIPGGESTTIGKLLVKYNLDKAIINKNKKDMSIYGTCAGAILLSKDIIGSDQPRLSLLDISIARNDYGRQIDSFETTIDTKELGKIKTIFIRAPVIKKINNKNIKVLAKHKENPVLIRQKNILAGTFHPELTDDLKVHKHFLEIVKITIKHKT